MINATEQIHLQRCIELDEAREGDEPLGRIRVGANSELLAEDRHRMSGADATQSPELSLARWAANRLNTAERVGVTVYTSGKHCPMCAATHGWVELGHMVYVSTMEQLSKPMVE